MKSFFEKMDARLVQQENALKDISNLSRGGGNGGDNGRIGGSSGGYRKRKNVLKCFGPTELVLMIRGCATTRRKAIRTLLLFKTHWVVALFLQFPGMTTCFNK